MLKSVKILGVMAFVLLAAGVSFAQTNEKITITTYYPSPYGVYNELRLYPHRDPVTPCGPDGLNAGTMFFDSDDKMLKICDGTSYEAAGWWGLADATTASPWTLSPQGNYIQNTNSFSGATNSVLIKARYNGGNHREVVLLTTGENEANSQALIRVMNDSMGPRVILDAKNSRAPVQPDNTSWVQYYKGRFDFGKVRIPQTNGPSHPWVTFSSNYVQFYDQDYQPGFAFLPPVGRQQTARTWDQRSDCEELCREKYVRGWTAPNAGEHQGITCVFATGSTSHGPNGPGTNSMNRIPCEIPIGDATNPRPDQINCFCAGLNLYDNWITSDM